MRFDTVNTLEIRFALPSTKLFTTVFETENPIFNIGLYESTLLPGFMHGKSAIIMYLKDCSLLLCIMIMIIHFAFYF